MDKEMVMFAVSQIKIKTAQHVLKAAQIDSYILDQTDSAHAGIFGDIKLYVHQELADKAKKLLIEQGILA